MRLVGGYEASTSLTFSWAYPIDQVLEMGYNYGYKYGHKVISINK